MDDKGDFVTIEPRDDVGSLGLHESWAALADGQHVQRLVLHLDQRRKVLAEPPAGIGLFS